MADIKALAAHVDDAARNATEIPQLTESISLADAYAIQKESLARRYARGELAGERVCKASRATLPPVGVRMAVASGGVSCKNASRTPHAPVPPGGRPSVRTAVGTTRTIAPAPRSALRATMCSGARAVT